MNQQRSIIYKQRRDVLDGGEGIADTIRRMVISTVSGFVRASFTEGSAEAFFEDLRASMPYLSGENDVEYANASMKEIEELLCDRAMEIYATKEEIFRHELFLELQRSILLRNVDMAWMDHIDAMHELKNEINLQSYANRNPVNEYRIIGGDMFDAMVEEIREKTARNILTAMPRPAQQIHRVQVANPLNAGLEGQVRKTVNVTRVKTPEQSAGRNMPCPCGSGKKYKNCCGAPGRQKEQ